MIVQRYQLPLIVVRLSTEEIIIHVHLCLTILPTECNSRVKCRCIREYAADLFPPRNCTCFIQVSFQVQ